MDGCFENKHLEEKHLGQMSCTLMHGSVTGSNAAMHSQHKRVGRLRHFPCREFLALFSRLNACARPAEACCVNDECHALFGPENYIILVVIERCGEQRSGSTIYQSAECARYIAASGLIPIALSVSGPDWTNLGPLAKRANCDCRAALCPARRSVSQCACSKHVVVVRATVVLNNNLL